MTCLRPHLPFPSVPYATYISIRRYQGIHTETEHGKHYRSRPTAAVDRARGLVVTIILVPALSLDVPLFPIYNTATGLSRCNNSRGPDCFGFIVGVHSRLDEHIYHSRDGGLYRLSVCLCLIETVTIIERPASISAVGRNRLWKQQRNKRSH